MFVIDRVELVDFDKPFEVGKLERDRAIGRQQTGHPGGKIVQVGNLRQDIVTDDEISAGALPDETPRQIQSKELNQRRYAFVDRGRGNVAGRLDTNHRNIERQKVLQQVAVIAGDLEYPTVASETEPIPDHHAVSARMFDPAGRVRRKIGVVSEDTLWFHVFLQLNQEAAFAHENAQGKVRLHLVDLVGRQEAFAKR